MGIFILIFTAVLIVGGIRALVPRRVTAMWLSPHDLTIRFVLAGRGDPPRTVRVLWSDIVDVTMESDGVHPTELVSVRRNP